MIENGRCSDLYFMEAICFEYFFTPLGKRLKIIVSFELLVHHLYANCILPSRSTLLIEKLCLVAVTQNNNPHPNRVGVDYYFLRSQGTL
jgi:hypothetical protein